MERAVEAEDVPPETAAAGADDASGIGDGTGDTGAATAADEAGDTGFDGAGDTGLDDAGDAWVDADALAREPGPPRLATAAEPGAPITRERAWALGAAVVAAYLLALLPWLAVAQWRATHELVPGTRVGIVAAVITLLAWVPAAWVLLDLRTREPQTRLQFAALCGGLVAVAAAVVCFAAGTRL